MFGQLLFPQKQGDKPRWSVCPVYPTWHPLEDEIFCREHDRPWAAPALPSPPPSSTRVSRQMMTCFSLSPLIESRRSTEQSWGRATAGKKALTNGCQKKANKKIINGQIAVFWLGRIVILTRLALVFSLTKWYFAYVTFV